MQEKEIVRGEEIFIESISTENRFGVAFEDDGETAYFYAMELDEAGAGMRILDALHIYEGPEGGEGNEEMEGEEGNDEPESGDENETRGGGNENEVRAGEVSKLLIVWSRDWMKCALVLDGYCQAIYDFEAQGGYSINEFPEPNGIWTKGDRKLTNELIKKLF